MAKFKVSSLGQQILVAKCKLEMSKKGIEISIKTQLIELGGGGGGGYKDTVSFQTCKCNLL